MKSQHSENPDIPDAFTTKEAQRLSGLSKTMLDYLVRMELVLPSRSAGEAKRGVPRLYSFSDIITLRTMKELLSAGISVIQLKRSLRQLFHGRDELTPGKIPRKYLVTDGRDLYYWDRIEMVENLSKGGQLAFLFILDLTPIHEKLIDDITSARQLKTA